MTEHQSNIRCNVLSPRVGGRLAAPRHRAVHCRWNWHRCFNQYLLGGSFQKQNQPTVNHDLLQMHSYPQIPLRKTPAASGHACVHTRRSPPHWPQKPPVLPLVWKALPKTQYPTTKSKACNRVTHSIRPLQHRSAQSRPTRSRLIIFYNRHLPIELSPVWRTLANSILSKFASLMSRFTRECSLKRQLWWAFTSSKWSSVATKIVWPLPALSTFLQEQHSTLPTSCLFLPQKWSP